MQKTFVPKNPGAARSWKLFDATDKPLGRLAVHIANALRAKDRPTFDPSIDQGDFVIVINADKVRLSLPLPKIKSTAICIAIDDAQSIHTVCTSLIFN